MSFSFKIKYLNDQKFFVADVRDRHELVNKMRDVDIVIHAAALKHVVLCERSPEQAVQINVVGVEK